MNPAVANGTAQNLCVDLQWQCPNLPEYPDEKQILLWAKAAIETNVPAAELSVRIVDSDEMQHANHNWREKDKPTNVLSFPASFPEEAGINYLGDILICADVLSRESDEQQKFLIAHWAHIVIHGVLHLQGYDHIDDQDALRMEQREIEVLRGLGFDNPYETN